MGIQGIYKEIGPGRRVALSKLALDKFEETGRPLRIAIDVSIWLFQIQASKGGTNPALRTFYYRLLRLIALSIHPIFVFDGPNKPPFKRNKKTGGPGTSVASIPEFLAKQLLKQFGFPIHLAPGEAEAECALLQREGIVDAVLSEDVDTLMFGSGVTIRNWSPEQKSSKTPTHVNVYNAVDTKTGPSGLDREGMILVALMSGGDYVPEGIPGCGPKTACEAARAGFGKDLCQLARGDTKGIREWRERLQHELKTNENKLFNRKRPSMTIPDDFPRSDILGYYTHPAISNQAGLDKLRRSINWDQDLDFPGLRSFTHDAFEWVKLEGAKHFIRSLAPSLLVRHLRLRGEQTEKFPSNDLQAVQEDEALLVKGIHGKRQHIITDSSIELRVSFTPIELVKIDLSTEELDEDIEMSPGPEVDLDDEIPLEIDDDPEGPKKRGPTKFDPSKPARVWVMETYVKVGVPLKVQDWEAERQRQCRSKRPASANDAGTTAPKARGGRRTKTTDNSAQISIQNFTKVTKPGVKLSQAPLKAHITAAPQPTKKSRSPIVSLLSSSPIRNNEDIPPRCAREKSHSPVSELPSSVTKRRRGPMQRAHTLPSNPTTALDLPKSLPSDMIETLDLVDPPPLPSPSQAPAKKARTQALKNPEASLIMRAASVTTSPGKIKQSTLDAWRSPVGTPTKTRKTVPVVHPPLMPRAPRFEIAEEAVETLDLTLSSPQELTTRVKSTRADTSASSNRLPLVLISTNASNTSIISSSTRENPKTKARPEASSCRTSPRFHKRKSASPEVETLDMTQLSSLPPASASPPVTCPAPLSASLLPESNLRRSPRSHESISSNAATRKDSPPAAWKTQAKKKREIVLRESLVGAWTYVDAESPVKEGNDVRLVLKGKDRRRWRESEIEVLDLC
ncbi:hypothetical protein N0V90_007279 [Kalmusia sp. IMI 367209]|nr:hypothetical protein N0V90_007279 [Kalmusia sp. IMI 367209]